MPITRPAETAHVEPAQIKPVVHQAPADALFMGVFPGGIVYADRRVEVDRDYKRVAFLPYRSLLLEVAAGCPADLRPAIVAHAASIQARVGQEYQISTSGQTVILGYTVNGRPLAGCSDQDLAFERRATDRFDGAHLSADSKLFLAAIDAEMQRREDLRAALEPPAAGEPEQDSPAAGIEP